MALKRGAVAAAVLTTAVFAGPAHHHHPTQQRLLYGSSQDNYDVQYLSTAAQQNALAGVGTQPCATAAASAACGPKRCVPRGYPLSMSVLACISAYNSSRL